MQVPFCEPLLYYLLSTTYLSHRHIEKSANPVCTRIISICKCKKCDARLEGRPTGTTAAKGFSVSTAGGRPVGTRAADIFFSVAEGRPVVPQLLRVIQFQ